jgi:lysophospholipase L1-like esterase
MRVEEIPAVDANYRFNGGQLSALHASLKNPLEQRTVIAFFGDSITWGATVEGNAPQYPRNGTAEDRRDVFASASFVNEVKRHIGARYFDDAAPVLSNWSFSSSGESTATYSRVERLYTNKSPFSKVDLVGSATSADDTDAAALLGKRHSIALAPGASASFAFHFTGTDFDIVYNSVPGQSADYEVLVDGASLGIFFTDAGSLTWNLSRTHSFEYVRRGTITIRALYPAGASGVSTLRLSGVVIRKSCSIVNQGIIGITASRYAAYNFGYIGPSMLTTDLNFVLLQLGTNDRISQGAPNDLQTFRANLAVLLGKIAPHAGLILMNSAPVAASLEGAPTYVFSMTDVRDVVREAGEEMRLDVIDNHMLFGGMDTGVFLADGLHPNELGHRMIAKNIIGALRDAESNSGALD